ncbi:glycosyl transferase family 2 [Hymenobacter roseosalivarius DSM 11622]|uniref:Glycosyl transferase family 2 n=1 Tax=Hymenobacter roseosalivarius DSM 11622 TaxID=645990 RepID=A0A1W1V8Z0_9BACT|nr:glycosyltransferase family A protein [Hymenobacter roseosalivarius]SMB89521.1 glycosyl transferase family 2 [Hymenobacter roseosalivarius DSM 11622]
MTVSIIVPTYNGAHKILAALQALEQQTYPITEVIVVVDGSTDQTLELLKNNTTTIRSLQIVKQQNQGRAATRNRGAQEATSDLLVFCDDDMRLLPGCIAAHVKHHQKELDTIGVGTQVEDLAKVTTDFLHYKALMSRSWMTKYSGADTVLMPATEPFITAANFSISKKKFVALEGFERGLRDAEDFDLAMRAAEALVPIYFLNKAEAWHDDLVNCASYINRLREYQQAQQKLAQLRPSLYAKYGRFGTQPQNKLKMKTFSMFANRSLVKLIDRGSLTNLLPQALRYKVYDIVITALGVYFPER